MSEGSSRVRDLMKGQPIVLPSILSADFGRLAEEVQEMDRLGAEMLHVDIMDGHFVPNITIGPDVVAAVHRATSLPLDVHLMLSRPEQHIDAFAKAGASVITVHVEACIHLNSVVCRIHDLGCLAGVSLNPATPISSAEEILNEIDLLLVMTVNPGFGGQRFVRGGMEKLGRAAALIESAGREIVLEADGGLGPANAEEAGRAGVRWMVAGSAIFNAEDRWEAFKRTLAACRRGYEHFSSKDRSSSGSC